MAAVVYLNQIPTVAELYKTSALKATTPPYYPSNPPELNERVALMRGDITGLSLDAIVNAAKTSLLGGGGVDGAIHRRAGRGLANECATLGGCPTGQARITRGYRLPAKHVIHTVGPVYAIGDKATSEAMLRSCYEESLRLAVGMGLTTIAFSGISTGVFGYPSRAAAMVACDTVRKFLEWEGRNLIRVVFVTFEQKDMDAYNELLPKFFPPE